MSILLFEGQLVNTDNIDEATEMEFSVFIVVPGKGKLRFNDEEGIAKCLQMFTERTCNCEFKNWYRTTEGDFIKLSTQDKYAMLELGEMLTWQGYLTMCVKNV